MSIIVHHLENSRSQRVLWLLEELGVPYEVKFYKRDPANRQPAPELRALKPLGKAPTVEMDGEFLAETGAIFETLLDRVGQGKLRPATGSPERVRYYFWMHYPEGSVMPNITLRFMLNYIADSMAPELRDAVKAAVEERNAAIVAPNFKKQMDFLDAELARSKFVAGDQFTAADVMMGSTAEFVGMMCGRAETIDTRANVKAWLAALNARPAALRAAERGRAPA